MRKIILSQQGCSKCKTLADQAIESAKKEKNRIGHMLYELQSKWGNEKRILGNMRLHRHELKQLKQMMKNQHKMIRDKTCQ